MKNNNCKLIAGAAATNITPLDSQFLFGYPFVERISKGVHDWLLSSALYMANGNGQVLLISNDVIYLNKASVFYIRKTIYEKTGILESNIMVSATHTHSGPVTVDCMNSSNDPVVPKADTEYVRYMENKTIEAACNAYQNARPAKIAFLMADGTGIGTNRHDPSGPADLNIPTLVIKDLNDEFISCILVCNMHPTILHEDSKLFSGDFPAFTREILQKHYFGCECPVLYFTGAAGNQSPRHVTRENSFDEARRIGEIIATSIGSKINDEKIEFSSKYSVFSFQKMVDLPIRQFPNTEWAKDNSEKARELFEYLKNTSANQKEIRTAEVNWFGTEELLHLTKLSEKGRLEQVYQSCLPAEIQVIRIGKYNFVAWPGEIFIEYAIELKRKQKNSFLITLTNGELQGYVATEEAEMKGFYEASNSIFHHSSGKVLLDATIKLIKTIG